MRRKKAETTVIANGTELEGGLHTSGHLHVEGAVKGQVEVEGDVTVGSEGRMEGELRAVNVSVAGRVEGMVRVSGHLCVLPGGVVTNDVRYGSLEIQRGGSILGQASQFDADGDETSNGVGDKLRSAPPSAVGHA